jgi:hypothetical protein
MKNSLIKLASSLLLAFAVCHSANANPISGTINFTGGVTFDTGNPVTATAVTGWDNTKVQGASGDFVTEGVVQGDVVTFNAPWSLNSGALDNFWSVDGFTFDLIASKIVFQAYGAVVVTGTGTVSHEGYDSYVGDWTFSANNPVDRSGNFSFSGGSAVPDGGTTAMLLGAGLVSLSLAARRRKVA